MTPSPQTVVWFLAGLLLVPVPLTQAATDPTDGLAVRDRVSVAGAGNVSLDGRGAVHIHGQETPNRLTLQAEEITLEYEWDEGRTAGPPGQEQFYRQAMDKGRASESFSDVSLDVSTFQHEPEVLAYGNGSEPRIRSGGTGDQVFARLETRFLTGVGVPPDAESTNGSREIGFWYSPDGDWMAAHGSDEATVDGDFSLFLNNLTVAVRQGGKTVWENWTGYREETTGPAASSYERHLLQAHVTNGTLTVAEDDGISVFGSLLGVEANGIVTAETATGRLDLEDAAFAFDGEPLRMEGEGSFHIRESSTDPASGLALSVEEGSRFDVLGGQRVDPGLGTDEGVLGWRLWTPLSLLGLAVAGAVAHHAGYTKRALTRWRSDRYTKWMTRGRELANAADYDQAATCFRRATRAQPAKGVAWYHLAIALLEDGRPREVLGVIDEAREGQAVIDELDFLDLEAQAARRAGDHERCRAAVAQLADGSEAMAATLVRDLGLSEALLGHKLATRLAWTEDETEGEGLPGYA